MFQRLATRSLAPLGRRTFAIDSKIAAKRASPSYASHHVGAENPTYLKEGGDKIFFAISFVGMGLGVANIFAGLYSMGYGMFFLGRFSGSLGDPAFTVSSAILLPLLMPAANMNRTEDISAITRVLNSVRLFLYGVIAFASTAWISIPILWGARSHNTIMTTVKCMLFNALFVYCFQAVVDQGFAMSSTPTLANFENGVVDYITKHGSLFLPFVWLLPGFILGLTKGGAYSQELADELYLKRMGGPVNADIKKHSGDGGWAFLIWIFMMIQIAITYDHVPGLLHQGIQRFFDILASLSSDKMFQLILSRAHASMKFVTEYLAKLTAIILQCSIYALYPFEPVWISLGTSAAQRCQAIEARWEYMVGFGLPMVILARTMTFFGFYYLFMLTFPFVIAGAAAHDYNTGYSTSTPVAANMQKLLTSARTSDQSKSKAAKVKNNEGEVHRICSELKVYNLSRYIMSLVGQAKAPAGTEEKASRGRSPTRSPARNSAKGATSSTSKSTEPPVARARSKSTTGKRSSSRKRR